MSHASSVGSPASGSCGLLQTEPTPDHRDKDTLVPGLEEKGEGEGKAAHKPIGSGLPKHTDPQLDGQGSLEFLCLTVSQSRFIPSYSQDGTGNQY